MLGKVQRFAVCTRYIESLHRCLATKTASEPKTKVRAPKKVTPVQEKEVYQHFNTPTRKAALNYPEEFFIKKRSKVPNSFYIADKLAALEIVKELQKDLPENKMIMEINPGIGLLTQLLIEETKNDLFLYEQDKNLFYKMAVS
jgi:hypothetical protein